VLGVLVAAAAMSLAACASLAPHAISPTDVGAGVSASAPSPGASATSTPLPRSSPRATPTESTGSALTVGIGDNGATVVVDVGQILVVTLPNPSEREINHDMVESSNPAVLQLTPQEQPAGQFVALLRVPFRALRAGVATITATGPAAFRLQVNVVVD
jgi:hypothetical protein